MSTRIYNGYTLKIPPYNFRDILEWCKDVKSEFEINKKIQINQTFARVLTENLDLQTLGLRPKAKFGLVAELFSEIRENQKGPPQQVSMDWQLKVEILFIPLPDKMLVLFYGNNKYLKTWEQTPEVVDYHFQNQTDKPKNITEQEWKTREKDWDVALPGPGIPNHNGLVYTLVDDTIPYPSFNDYELYLPAKSERARNMAKNIIAQNRMNAANPQDAIQEYMRSLDYFKSPEGEKEILEKTKEIEPQLVSDLTTQVFHGT